MILSLIGLLLRHPEIAFIIRNVMKKKNIEHELKFINDRLIKLNCVSEIAQVLNNEDFTKIIVKLAIKFSELENNNIDLFLKSDNNGRLD